MSKKNLCTRIDEQLLERMRNFVYWTPGVTMGRLVEESMELCMTTLEEKRGGPFPDREGKLTKKV